LTVLDLLNLAREDGWQSGVQIKKKTGRTLIWAAYRPQHGGQP